jgi:hypothetical protein
MGFTGAGLRSTFGFRGIEALGSGGIGAVDFDVLGSDLICGVVVARRRECVKAEVVGLSARGAYRPLTSRVLWRRAAIELRKELLIK